MDHIRVYIPVNRELDPQYKIGNTFYNAITLRPEHEVPHDKAFSLHFTELESRPLLVYTRNGGWILFDSRGRNSRLLGSSSSEDQNDVPIRFFELEIPSGQISNNSTLERGSIIGYSENLKRDLERVIERSGELRFSSLNQGIAVPIYVSPQNIPEQQSTPLAQLAQPEQQSTKLAQISYETLVKQLYGLPVVLPTSLIVNDLRLEFIPFSQLSTIQIERYIIEPLLQPWAGPPSTRNRIITIFGTNGMTYLVKALYDQSTNRIFPPV